MFLEEVLKTPSVRRVGVFYYKPPEEKHPTVHKPEIFPIPQPGIFPHLPLHDCVQFGGLVQEPQNKLLWLGLCAVSPMRRRKEIGSHCPMSVTKVCNIVRLERGILQLGPGSEDIKYAEERGQKPVVKVLDS